MRMTIDVDDELLACAAVLTGISERSVLIRDAVELLVRIETGRQLTALGGSDQAAEAAPRSRERGAALLLGAWKWKYGECRLSPGGRVWP